MLDWHSCQTCYPLEITIVVVVVNVVVVVVGKIPLLVQHGNEPPRDKTNKVSVRPPKTQISLGIRPV